jgi:hypothetical protein
MLQSILQSGRIEHMWVGVERLEGGDGLDININIEVSTRSRTDKFHIESSIAILQDRGYKGVEQYRCIIQRFVARRLDQRILRILLLCR